MAATARLNLARLLRSTGEGAAAIALLRENVEWYAGAGGGDGALLSRCLLAAETDDRDSLEEVLTLARADENHMVTILALDGLARLSADEGEPERATELVAEADALHPQSLIARRRRPTRPRGSAEGLLAFLRVSLARLPRQWDARCPQHPSTMERRPTMCRPVRCKSVGETRVGRLAARPRGDGRRIERRPLPRPLRVVAQSWRRRRQALRASLTRASIGPDVTGKLGS